MLAPQDKDTHLSFEDFVELLLGPSQVELQSRVETPNLAFIDQNEGEVVDDGAHFNGELDDVPGIDLATFLSRPVNITTLMWNQDRLPTSNVAGATNPLISEFDPWTLFLNNTKIKYKLNNFAYIRGNLHVKFVLSSQPFYYGSVLVSYRPLPNFKSDIGPTSHSIAQPVTYSQRQHVWLYPQHNSGGEMILPFFWPYKMADLTSASEIANLGRLNVWVVNQLQAANGVATREVTIQVFAWMTDVEITGPTVGLALQSKVTAVKKGKDEYDGPISGPASAVASAAGALSSIPAIAPFATAAQIGASAIAKVSSLFGYTNTPVVTDAQNVRPTPFPNISSPEISHAIEKLTLDPKNELSIDPGIVGLKGVDELNLKHLLTKWSLIDVFKIPLATEPTDGGNLDLVWTARVNPNNYVINASLPVGMDEVAFTPAGWLAQMFQYWRGDLIYKFTFICTKFHKGRVRIMWDPKGTAAQNICNDRDSSAVVKNVIVDVGETTEVEFRVPYAQRTPYCMFDWNLSTATNHRNGPFLDDPTYTVDRTYRYNDSRDNGMIGVRIVNRFTAPATDADVWVNVSVRCAENIDYAGPRNLSITDNPGAKIHTYFYPQSLVEDVPPHPEKDIEHEGMAGKAAPETQLICMGEKVTNLRQLIRRSGLVCSITNNHDASNDLHILQLIMGRLPPGPGYATNNLWTAAKLDGTGSVAFSYCKMTALAWIANAFIGMRGSVNWAVNATHPTLVKKHVRAYRTSAYSDLGLTKVNRVSGGLTDNGCSRFVWVYTEAGTSGHSLTNADTNAGLSISYPMYNNCLFESTDPEKPLMNNPSVSPYDGSEESRLVFEIKDAPVGSGATSTINSIDLYAGAGSDFTLHYFLNAPLTYVHAVPNLA